MIVTPQQTDRQNRWYLRSTVSQPRTVLPLFRGGVERAAVERHRNDEASFLSVKRGLDTSLCLCQFAFVCLVLPSLPTTRVVRTGGRTNQLHVNSW